MQFIKAKNQLKMNKNLKKCYIVQNQKSNHTEKISGDKNVTFWRLDFRQQCVSSAIKKEL